MHGGKGKFDRLKTRAERFTRQAHAIDPEFMLQNAVVVKVADRKGVFFMFHDSTQPAVVNAIAAALNELGFSMASQSGVVELFTTVDIPGKDNAAPTMLKKRFYGVALDPDDVKVARIINARHETDLQKHLQPSEAGEPTLAERLIRRNGKIGYTHPHIGGDTLPSMDAMDAARALVEHFATQGRAPRLRVDKGVIHTTSCPVIQS